MKRWCIFILLSLMAFSTAEGSLIDLKGKRVGATEPLTLSVDKKMDLAPQNPSTTEDAKTVNASEKNEDKAPSEEIRQTRMRYACVALGGISILTLITFIPIFLRIRREQRIQKTAPESWDEILEVAHCVLHQFGRKVFGRSKITGKKNYSLLTCESGRQWMITSRADDLFDCSAWLVTINHSCTHFEVHHNEARRDSVRTEDLRASSLFAALIAASKYGPFRVTRQPHGTWTDASLR